MNYRRILLLTELGRGDAALRRVRRLAPEPELLVILVHLPERQLPWFSNAAPRELRRAGAATLQAMREAAAGAAHTVEVRPIATAAPSELAEYAAAAKFDLLAVGVASPVLLPAILQLHRQCRLPVSWPVGRLTPPPGHERLRAIDLPDVVDLAGVLRARIEYAAGVGRRDPIADQEIAFVAEGAVVATASSHGGYAELLLPSASTTLGVYRVERRPGAAPADALEVHVDVIRAGTRPLLIFPADLSDADLALIAASTRDDVSSGALEVLAIRMRATKSCRQLRARLRAVGLPAQVADASAVLDEGDALDVDIAIDAVRLARVATRMRAVGFPVVGIVCDNPAIPVTLGFSAHRPQELAGSKWNAYVAASPNATRMDEIAPAITGNHVELELDNATARRWLLDAIKSSRECVHLQVYMAADDDIGAQVGAALAAAGSRGVSVRVLVDSLHGRHGSLGARNPLLDRLSRARGVELRVSGAMTGIPSLEDLKQRDHRKVAIADHAIALVGGRNLSHEYYTGFDEVQLTPISRWREVPWLDAGARVTGPAVSVLQHSFLEAWCEAGGAPFIVRQQADEGSTSLRVVNHRGLRDAATLEAYLTLIEAAESHVFVVNGFPLMLEIQHALLRALRRNVRVAMLVGHLTPRYGDRAFSGPWSRARTAATEFVHSRVDALIAAGGEGYQFMVAQQPGWAVGLGPINPHVHAKVMSVDGRVCAVGSANLDFTAGYWENELMLVIEDVRSTRTLEARIEQLFAASQRVDRNDASWQQLAERRDWMRRWPGALSV